jgi:hypothetical protein
MQLFELSEMIRVLVNTNEMMGVVGWTASGWGTQILVSRGKNKQSHRCPQHSF